MSFVTLSVLLHLFWPQDSGTKTYEVHRLSSEMVINGFGTSDHWNQAALLTDFRLPWRDQLAEPTTFRALWDDSHFYFLYQVIDLDVVTPGDPNDPRGVLPSDRIEIFFKVDGGMDPYYCLEMDPLGRVFDYKGQYYRNSDFGWSWPKGQLEVLANKTSDGYIVEGKIGLQSLRELGILEGTDMDAGLFRGDYYHTSADETDVRWISWVLPDSDHPDFHIPSAFGKLVLVDQ